MEVGNGGIAMEVLYKLISYQITDEQERERHIQELLRYCGQDSLAMVRIYEEIVGRM
jgi:hypothetical protein